MSEATKLRQIAILWLFSYGANIILTCISINPNLAKRGASIFWLSYTWVFLNLIFSEYMRPMQPTSQERWNEMFPQTLICVLQTTLEGRSISYVWLQSITWERNMWEWYLSAPGVHCLVISAIFRAIYFKEIIPPKAKIIVRASRSF